jgi:quinoprotein glucose dehydrogenase
MFGGCLVLIGLVMAVGGLNLVILGGSTYYLVASLFLSVSGYLLLQGRRRSGAWVYVAALALTIAWALFEVDLDFWLLIPRVDGPLAIGLILLIFWARAPLGRRSLLNYHKPLGVSSSAAVCVTVLVAVAVIGYFFLTHWPSSLATEPIVEPAAPILEGAREWRHYGNTLKGQRYAPLAQLTHANIAKLQVAWTYRTGEMPRDDDPWIVTFEATPIKIRDTLYLCSPRNVVIALDAETGQQRWRYDPRVQIAPNMTATCRGVSFHEAALRTMSQCWRRIIFGTGDARLIALDADSGELCSEFGENGVVDLRSGLGEVKAGQYAVTSAPTIVGDIAIIGAQIPKNVSDGPSGVVRAFNVITGALVWNWDSARPDKTTPLELGETYTRSSPNSWGPSSADEELGLVYLPTSGQPPDAWGGYRDPVSERYSNAIVALETATGRVRWVFQTVHHDVWNLDIGAQPTLVDIQTATGIRRALLAVSKRGDIFVLDRRTGEPIVPAPEKPVPQGAAPGDEISPIQPFSELSFQPAPLSEKDMWGVTPIDHLWCRNQFRRYRYQGIFTPQTHEGRGSLIYPGHYGVFNWGGVAVDEQRQIMIVNPSYVAYYSRLIRRNPQPHLANVRGEVATGPQEDITPEAPFEAEYGAFLSPLRIPCNAPPWGQLAAVDLRTNKILWQRKLGTTRDKGLGLALPLGVPSLGGPILTQTGLVLIAATIDDYLRAFDILTGKELWRGRLPAGGQATPMTYISAESGRQFVVISAGGHGGIGTQRGDYVIAFALPKSAMQGSSNPKETVQARRLCASNPVSADRGLRCREMKFPGQRNMRQCALASVMARPFGARQRATVPTAEKE